MEWGRAAENVCLGQWSIVRMLFDFLCGFPLPGRACLKCAFDLSEIGGVAQGRWRICIMPLDGATSPKATSKPCRALRETASALDEITQRLVQVLVCCCKPQRPRPFAPRPGVDFVWIGRAKDHGGERSGSLTDEYPRRCSPKSALDGLALLRPHHDDFENGGQILIDRISVRLA